MCLFYRYVFPTADMATSGATSSQVGVTSPHNISLMGRKYNYDYEWIYIKLEMTMTRKSGPHLHVTYGALNSCFDLIRSHQQCTPWSPPLEIEPTTTVCRSRNSTTGSLVHNLYKRCRIKQVTEGVNFFFLFIIYIYIYIYINKKKKFTPSVSI